MTHKIIFLCVVGLFVFGSKSLKGLNKNRKENMFMDGKVKRKDKRKEKKGSGKAVKIMQKMARAFLVPLSLLSAASLMLAFCSLFEQEAIVNLWPAFFNNEIVSYIFTVVLEWAGLLVLQNLGLIYAVALAFSLAKTDKEYAAFGALVGYLAFLLSMGLLVTSWPNVAAMFPENTITTMLGFETVNCGILGGMFTGIICYLLHEKFKDVKLPMAFSFFQGIRFVPIICLIVMTVIGQIFPFLWVYVAKGIELLGESLNMLGSFSVFLYGFVERLLIPTGLHQIWNAIVRTTSISGQYVFSSGAQAIGVTEAYALYLKEGLPIIPEGITTVELIKYQFGPQIPMMLGGLPAIALAIYQCADKDKRAVVKPLVISGIMCAVFAAVSEPIEFIFLFIAPMLYLAYAVLSGLSWWLCYILGSGVGGGESSIFGFFIHGVLRENSNWWIIVAVTVFQFIACYVLFRWYIIKFDVKTPGRGGDYDDSIAFAQEIAGLNQQASGDGVVDEAIDTTNPEIMKAQIIIKGLGGKENILNVDSCMTRLRVDLEDLSKVNKDILNKTGCSGMVEPGGDEIQIIYGPSVTMIKKTVLKLLDKNN